jgi:hypothetical protein
VGAYKKQKKASDYKQHGDVSQFHGIFLPTYFRQVKYTIGKRESKILLIRQ